jgi:hypothetical protein
MIVSKAQKGHRMSFFYALNLVNACKATKVKSVSCSEFVAEITQNYLQAHNVTSDDRIFYLAIGLRVGHHVLHHEPIFY